MHASRSVRDTKLKSDEPCISNPKAEISNRTLSFAKSDLRLFIFGFEMQDSSDFRFPLCLFSAAAILFIFSISGFAHHGAAAEYDLLHPVTLRGVVTEFRYVNPHSQIYFDVTDGNGNVVNWAGELNSPYSLTQDGWTKKRSMEALKPGTPVSVIICPGKS